ncbi:MAG: ribulose-phosphate 3-epimerase [Anaerolineae bacterium]|nr:ribulose-phosphate 3-epimerase [Anaerolineae bacterium]
MKKQARIAASILAADFAKLGEEIKRAEAGGVDEIHVDVMDGHFVPNISIGPPVVKSIRKVTDLPFDVHLMISEPEKYVKAFADAGANRINVQVEVDTHIQALEMIHDLGIQSGIVLNPDTPAESLKDVIAEIDYVLVMTVYPGFGGQAFMESTLPKISAIRRWLDDVNQEAWLAVDGGLNQATIGKACAAGADFIISGTSLFRAEEGIAAVVKEIRKTAQCQSD